MPKYATFDPAPAARARVDFSLRPATPDDADGIAALQCERDGGDPAEQAPQIGRSLASADARVWVAVTEADGDTAIAGFGRAMWYDPYAPPYTGSRNVPVGHYLTGVI